MPRGTRGRGRPRRWRAAVALALFSVAIAAAAFARQDVLDGTFAVFTDTDPVTGNTVGTGRIFSGTRTTAVFTVTDVSSGTAVDASSTTAFADGSYFLTRTWGSSFDANRYIEADLNAPLPGGLSVSSPQLTVVLASNDGGATACYYLEVRRASTGAVISTVGSSGSPAACASSTAWSTQQFNLTGVSTTDIADDLRVRIYGRDSASAAIRLDAVSVAGSSPYATFTLYPILTRELYSGTTELIYWSLAGQ